MSRISCSLLDGENSIRAEPIRLYNVSTSSSVFFFINLLRSSRRVYTTGSTCFESNTGSSSATWGSIWLSLSHSITLALLLVTDIQLQIGLTNKEANSLATHLEISSSALDFTFSLFEENKAAWDFMIVSRCLGMSLLFSS